MESIEEEVNGSEEKEIAHDWTQMANQRAFMDELGRKLGYQRGDLSAWYQVTVDQFRQFDGAGLLSRYKDSPYDLLRAVYPDYDFFPWKFKVSPTLKWQDETEVQRLLKYLSAEYGLKSIEDWRRLSQSRLKEIGVYQWIKQLGGVDAVIEKRFSK